MSAGPYIVRPMTGDERADWDRFVDRSENPLLFSRTSYLAHVGNVEILGAFSDTQLVAGFPIPVVRDGDTRAIRRTSYVSPYFTPVFARLLGPAVERDRARRHITTALLDAIQSGFESMALPLHHTIADMTPFQHAHFQLELRTTYELDLSLPMQTLWNELAAKTRNHIRRASSLRVICDDALAHFDFGAATFYEPPEGRRVWERLMRELHQRGEAWPLIAFDKERVAGGIFVAADRFRAYDLLSYFERGSHARGAPSRLIWAAVEEAVRRGLRWFDLEGSVLPRIEAFFQGFGGARRAYFQVHWYRNPSRQTPILYHYDEEAHG